MIRLNGKIDRIISENKLLICEFIACPIPMIASIGIPYSLEYAGNMKNRLLSTHTMLTVIVPTVRATAAPFLVLLKC